MSSSIEISLVVVDEHGATTRMEAVFEDTLARWPELHAEFARFSEAVHKTVFTEATPDREAGAEALAEPMTSGEVQRLLEQKGRDNHAAAERIKQLEADLRIRRQNVEDLTRQNEALQERNDNQKRVIDEQRAKLDLYEAGAPGVAALNERYNELHKQVWDGADEDTKLQDERDIARKERDRAIRERDDAFAVQAETLEKLNSLAETCTDLHRRIAHAVDAKVEVEKRLENVAAERNLANEKLLEAANERDAEKKLVQDLRLRLSERDDRIDRQSAKIQELLDKHIKQLQAAEDRYQKLAADALEQTEALGQALVGAVEATKAAIDLDTGALSEEMIHKSDAKVLVDGILKRVAPEAAPEEGKAPPF